jgi:hypothetical protein
VNELARAISVGLAQRADGLAVLGYWVPDPCVSRPAACRFGAILVHTFNRAPLNVAPILREHVDSNRDWSRGLLANLRGGMSLLAQCWEGEWRLWYSGPPGTRAALSPERLGAFPSHESALTKRNPRHDLQSVRLGRA